jgi:hypothetical protein
MAFLTAALSNPAALAGISGLLGGLFGGGSKKPVPLPEPKPPPRAPISVSDTAGVQRAGIATRARAKGGGISGLRLSLGKPGTEAGVTRKTLVGA